MPFGGIDRALVVDEAEEGGDIAQEERRQILATIAFVGRVSTTEHQGTCAGAIAWNAQIHGIAHVSAELELMVAADLGPIIDELELLFVLDQRTVADVAKRRYVTHDELGQARRELIARI